MARGTTTLRIAVLPIGTTTTRITTTTIMASALCSSRSQLTAFLGCICELKIFIEILLKGRRDEALRTKFK